MRATAKSTARHLSAISAIEAYPIQEFMRRSGLGVAAVRAARKAGLNVRYRHGKAFVLGSDFLAYLEVDPQEVSPALLPLTPRKKMTS